MERRSVTRCAKQAVGTGVKRSFGSSFPSAAFSEDDLKDLCHAHYATSAAPAEILTRRAVQLMAEGWIVDSPARRTFPPYLEAGRGDLGVYISVVDVDGETFVQVDALRIE
ncbi:MAG: hypothetical protein M3Q03_07820 [Chloroflexota bacterium]|nr:hypothetical protein [Chloroflexota bacterium]